MSDLLGCVLPCKTHTKVGPEMTWPSYNEAVSEVEWKLRHAPESMTRSDQLTAASVIAAYMQMIGDTQKKRNAVCKSLREAT